MRTERSVRLLLIGETLVTPMARRSNRPQKYLVSLTFTIAVDRDLEIDEDYPLCLSSVDREDPVHIDIIPAFVIDHEIEPCATLEEEGIELLEITESDIRPYP